MDLARIAWLFTVFALMIAVVILALDSYYGYAGVTLAVALSAAINLRRPARGRPPAGSTLGQGTMGPRRGQDSSHASSFRATRPRWLIASFSASLSSAIVRPSSRSSGMKAGS